MDGGDGASMTKFVEEEFARVAVRPRRRAVPRRLIGRSTYQGQQRQDPRLRRRCRDLYDPLGRARRCRPSSSSSRRCRRTSAGSWATTGRARRRSRATCSPRWRRAPRARATASARREAGAARPAGASARRGDPRRGRTSRSSTSTPSPPSSSTSRSRRTSASTTSRPSLSPPTSTAPACSPTTSLPRWCARTQRACNQSASLPAGDRCAPRAIYPAALAAVTLWMHCDARPRALRRARAERSTAAVGPRRDRELSLMPTAARCTPPPWRSSAAGSAHAERVERRARCRTGSAEMRRRSRRRREEGASPDQRDARRSSSTTPRHAATGHSLVQARDGQPTRRGEASIESRGETPRSTSVELGRAHGLPSRVAVRGDERDDARWHDRRRRAAVLHAVDGQRRLRLARPRCSSGGVRRHLGTSRPSTDDALRRRRASGCRRRSTRAAARCVSIVDIAAF